MFELVYVLRIFVMPKLKNARMRAVEAEKCDA